MIPYGGGGVRYERMSARSSGEPGLQSKERPGLLDVVEIDQDHVVATASNMLFLLWCLHTQAGAYRRAIRVASQLADRFREGVGACHYLEVTVIPPGSETRRAFVDFLRLPGLKHFSVTHEGAGFKAASVRAVVAGVHALGRPTCEHTVHKSITEAAEWHATQQAKIGRRDSADVIAKTIQTLRTLHKERYPVAR